MLIGEYRLIETEAELCDELQTVNTDATIAIDTETRGLDPNHPSGRLLGLSISMLGLATCKALYVPFFKHQYGDLVAASDFKTIRVLHNFLQCHGGIRVGHNATYDEAWLKQHFDLDPKFSWDTQILWHLSSAPWKHQGYGLKRAQRDVLGFTESGEKALFENIKKNGGNPKDGDYWMADLHVMAKYAAMDAHSTLLLYEEFKPFFDKHSYWDFAKAIQEYKRLLLWNTREGIPTDRVRLQELLNGYNSERLSLITDIHNTYSGPIQELEKEWLDAEVSKRKSERGKANFLADTSRHPKFNIASDPQLADLLYEKLGLPISEYTEKGKPKTNKLALKRLEHPLAQKLIKASRLEKLASSFAEPYLKLSEPDSKLHPAYNITGTLSGRLSGFSPNIQQMPFKEAELMSCFDLPDGEIGIHMDLVSIEPFFTAYFSQDPLLLKIYRDRQGDIYLDLALRLFPENLELKSQYDPSKAPTSEVKSRFKVERDISKTVHLACQYGGGAGTISKTLTLQGFPTTLDKARQIVKAYWKAFDAVKVFERGLYEVYKEDGKLINPFGRIVRLPEVYCKDLLNRFVQGTASDCLKAIVTEIAKINSQENLGMVPWLIDVHDATTWRVRKENQLAAVEAFESALARVNEKLALEFPVRGEVKVIRNLGEIKDE